MRPGQCEQAIVHFIRHLLCHLLNQSANLLYLYNRNVIHESVIQSMSQSVRPFVLVIQSVIHQPNSQTVSPLQRIAPFTSQSLGFPLHCKAKHYQQSFSQSFCPLAITQGGTTMCILLLGFHFLVLLCPIYICYTSTCCGTQKGSSCAGVEPLINNKGHL